ncbi:SubName: Full=Uncharacterized protein {ECO:0000313/EMBL:CCA78025.1} [Serendipita indica DSM 11827]|nr:SubName: Full=Uncharacterized protein {ECO:0000313/EMBL:CCA78025.1} [Serendipita indica DSM 11827]
MSSVTAPKRRPSKLFPPGYGDIKLITSDDIVFSFPRYLLSHCSSVFMDMLALGESDQENPEVTVTEDSTTMDAVLRFLDPEKDILPLNPHSAPKILEAAHKYQLPRIMKWWAQEVTAGPELENPMQCLALAELYGIRGVAKLALRALVIAPVAELEINLSFLGKSFSELIKLRSERIAKLHEVANELATTIVHSLLASTFNIPEQKKSAPEVSMLARAGSIVSKRFSQSASGRQEDKALKEHLYLQGSLTNLTQWTTNLMASISVEPSWKAILREICLLEAYSLDKHLSRTTVRQLANRVAKLENV